MNLRIRELAEQAKIQFTYDPTETPMRAFAECWEDELEKFAELIIAECVNVSLKSSHRYDDMGAIIANNIEDHFGVEE